MKTHGLITVCLLASIATIPVMAEKPLELGSRLELFVDDYLIDKTSGDVEQVLHKPKPQEVVLVTDKPWEGNTCAYYTIFQDDDLYRMYYRGSHFDEKTRKAAHPEVTCYAESKDGIHWTKPNLGLFEFNGSKENNIVWDGIGTHCFAAFKDANPNCDMDARYKAIARGRPRGKRGLYVFKSPDAIHWSLMHPEPVITEGAFDSQNLAFWDTHRGHYVDYHRNFREKRRDIMTATSQDFLTWTKPEYLVFPDAPKEHLYTNAIQQYDRAPHLLIGFPTRYLPSEASRVEPVFMSSRDGLTFRRWTEAVIPESAPKDRRGNRSNYMTWGLLELPGNQRELSVYGTEAYYTGPDSRVRRFTYRVDGFVSLRAGKEGGQLLSKPFTFDGSKLVVNFATEENGEVRVALVDANGKPLPGFSAQQCKPLVGDEIAGVVHWKGEGDLSKLAGTAVRLRVEMRSADLYSIQFRK
jgi:hypothetical protein